MKRYILKGKEVIEEPDLIKWAKYFENTDRTIALTLINDIKISTVFLGLNHNYNEGPPLLFETMVFGGDFDQEQERYSTYEEAEAGHKMMVKKLTKRN